MLTPYSRSQFVEKILTDCHGRQFKMLFLVSLVNGEVKARLISAEPLSCDALTLKGTATGSSYCLPSLTASKESETPYFSYEVTSPYFSLDYLIVSQPTRAPSSF